VPSRDPAANDDILDTRLLVYDLLVAKY
jgi:hypothetical protein